MVEISPGSASRMDEGLPQQHSEPYLLRFLVFFFMLMWVETGMLTARMVVIALACSLVASAVSYWSHRYRSRHKPTIMILELALLIFLGAIIWHQVEKQRHNAVVDSTFQVVRH